ncbi:hypothetical protein TELCIR_23409 [Teladorsagia circumcincta]|uniref:Uncharacterized protein n=1 Tax=Teladorsagia circumcincta TaxID=45464 RepID=A0A2G9TB92_TELCI|nr:hypothetical protein TELCIR_23409 [Teladorsagia circumcincta]
MLASASDSKEASKAFTMIMPSIGTKKGDYDKSFYAADMFHLSKYGNAVLGKFLWNTMLEPVGKKTTKADLGDDSAPLKCPSKESPFIQTLGNKS